MVDSTETYKLDFSSAGCSNFQPPVGPAEGKLELQVNNCSAI